MKKINWLYIGIGAVVLYFVYKKFFGTSSSTSEDIVNASVQAESMPNPAVVRSAVSQGDVVNDLAFASGMTNVQMAGTVPCFCNGAFLGYMSNSGCRKACRKAVKFETL